MRATDILMEEHRLIERVLKILETASELLEQGQPVRYGLFNDVVDFIQNFADGSHHKKEEGVLFGVMIDNGLPSQSGPIAVMLAEHEQGREYTRRMLEATQRLENGDDSARFDLIRNARHYATLLRQHIAKEDNILFPMADQVIPPEQQSIVAKDFELIELEEIGEGVNEKYLALVDALEKEI